MRLHVREAGPDGAPRMLLIHGASSNLLELWGPLAEEFSPLHRVIAYDRPGMGHSTRAKRDAHTMASQARCAARVLEQTGDGPAIIVAHSLGAGVALRLALDHPHLVSGLVLIAPACNPLSVEARVVGAAFDDADHWRSLLRCSSFRGSARRLAQAASPTIFGPRLCR
ncbi:MAG: alpha/beta fold hydrolase [Caulobacteraceae bacterium]|nr:alpha/beta fold hydrolase [Caulobacteraceae bacterium]